VGSVSQGVRYDVAPAFLFFDKGSAKLGEKYGANKNRGVELEAIFWPDRAVNAVPRFD
jgi:hypothetical protein